MLTQLGWRVEDTSADLDFQYNTTLSSPDPMNAKNCAHVGFSSNVLANVVETKIDQGLFPLILGGDHSIAIGNKLTYINTRTLCYSVTQYHN